LEAHVGARRLPETVVIAFMARFELESANRRATLSSIPGSQSMRTFFIVT
jgi:hypothetical protein